MLCQFFATNSYLIYKANSFKMWKEAASVLSLIAPFIVVVMLLSPVAVHVLCNNFI